MQQLNRTQQQIDLAAQAEGQAAAAQTGAIGSMIGGVTSAAIGHYGSK